MEENLKIKLAEGTEQVRIIHVKGLDEVAELKVDIAGNIDSAANFISKRREHFNVNESYLSVNYTDKLVSLFISPKNPRVGGKVVGLISIDPKIGEWRINTGEEWTHENLAHHIKMNRFFFEDKGIANKLFTALMNIKVDASTALEKENNNRGDFKRAVSQRVINSNIPDVFTVSLPIFKGTTKTPFEVEVYVNPSDFMVTLVSPQLAEMIEDRSEHLIDVQLEAIRALVPDLVFIEK